MVMKLPTQDHHSAAASKGEVRSLAQQELPTNGSTQRRRLRLLSVIIPAYNGEKTLGEQLDALKAQSCEHNWEIIIVNNCSTDRTLDIVYDYQRTMPNLQIVQALEKQGMGYARNVGARAAAGDAFIFCDADDVATPGWLHAMAEALAKHDLVAGAIDEHSLNGSAVLRPGRRDGRPRPALGFLPYAIGCNLAVSREAFERAGGFLEMEGFVTDDVEFSWRLQVLGYSLHYAASAVMQYRPRKTIRGLWNQISAYSACYPYLYRRYAPHGMPRASVWQAIRRYFWLIRKIPNLLSRNRKAQARWIYWAAVSWGRLRGSLRHRTLYL